MKNQPMPDTKPPLPEPPFYKWRAQLPLPAPFNHPPRYTFEGQEEDEGRSSPSSTPPAPNQRALL